jgi:hypothetical protein
MADMVYSVDTFRDTEAEMKILVLKNCEVLVRYTDSCGNGCCIWHEWEKTVFSAGQILFFSNYVDHQGTVELFRVITLNNRGDCSSENTAVSIYKETIRELIEAGAFQKI